MILAYISCSVYEYDTPPGIETDDDEPSVAPTRLEDVIAQNHADAAGAY